jgi:hypothetical protein
MVKQLAATLGQGWHGKACAIRLNELKWQRRIMAEAGSGINSNNNTGYR